MPKATVPANARALSKALKSTPAKSCGSAQLADAPAAASVPAFDLNQARTNWQAACAEYDAASERYLTTCSEIETLHALGLPSVPSG